MKLSDASVGLLAVVFLSTLVDLVGASLVPLTSTLPPNASIGAHTPGVLGDCQDVRLFDPKVHKTKYNIGVNAIRGLEVAFKEYNMTFNQYLTETAGKKFDPPIAFEIIPEESMSTIFEDIEHGKLDFLFVNPGAYSCAGVEYHVQALTTVISHEEVRGHVFELDQFGGVIFARADNKQVNSMADLKNKIIGAGSIATLMAGQVQFDEMIRAGLDRIMDPKQVVFTYEQQDIVMGVLHGEFDVGFVRTHQIERTLDADGDPLDPELFKIINPQVFVMDDGNLFPFLHSTDIYPEWPVAALPHVPSEVVVEVQNALLKLQAHANAAMEYIYEGADEGIFSTTHGCGTTKKVAELALDASKAGHLAGFRPPRSYFQVRSMHEDAGFLKNDEKGNWKCTTGDGLYESITCPDGHYKLDPEGYEQSCAEAGLVCKEGYSCYCRPCVKAFEVDVFEADEAYERGDRRGCDKMALCGTVQQTKTITFTIMDNQERENSQVTVMMHMGAETVQLPVTDRGNFRHDFSWSNNQVGVGVMEIFYNGEQIPGSPIRVQVIERNCEIDLPGRQMTADDDGWCVCKEGTLDISGACVSTTFLAVIISIISLFIVVIVGGCILRYKAHKNDEMWMVTVDDLHFDDPVEIVGQGSFGVVLLAEYRGTKVAIKRAVKGKGRYGSAKSSRGRSGKFHGSKETTTAAGSNDSVEINYHDDGESEETPPESVDIEVGNGGTASRGSVNYSFGTSRSKSQSGTNGEYSLGFLADDFGRENKFAWMFPWLKQNDHQKRFKESILGSSGGGSSSKKSMGAIYCPWFNEQARREEEFVAEMRVLSRLRHPCITTVMGAVITRAADPMLVMEYMEYGSLYDILRNETMYLSGEIILQVCRDVAQGLRYLHSSRPAILHGDLKARNILVDSRFRAKLCDFGLATKKKNLITGTPFWLAPEYLRGQTDYNEACDIYACGIILYEIYSRATPFEGEMFRETLRKICDRRINKRPPVPPSCPPKVAELMQKCWSADPGARPQAKELDMTLLDFSVHDVEPNQDKSQKQISGKPRVQLSLYQLFPKKVADALSAGQKVEPETHDMVTVIFSDIVGFTTISQKLGPSKVSDMLDRLYLAFDKLSSEHQVFKVETIGDAYMGVTNLENGQSDTHVRHAAEFAIGMIREGKKILIDQEDPSMGCINIRVGFHSGPVVSNVIGSLNPRFGLFGDTVNTASRMESNSKANRVLCSEKSYLILREQAPTMPARKRGTINVKGKGDMNVYWVGGTKLTTVNAGRRVSAVQMIGADGQKRVGFDVDESDCKLDVSATSDDGHE